MTPLVIGHRGASGTSPENTLPAFRRAVELGCPMIELDVQFSADRALVVIHDDTLDRTTSGRGAVARTPLATIAALDAGSWFDPTFADARVPTLSEVLAAIPIRINVELKAGGGDDGLEVAVADCVAEAGALDRVVFSSFDAGYLSRLRAYRSDADIGLLSARRVGPSLFAAAEALGAAAVHLEASRVDGGVVGEARRRGMAVRVWTVNDPGQATRLRGLGVDAIFTDFPERFLPPGSP